MFRMPTLLAGHSGVSAFAEPPAFTETIESSDFSHAPGLYEIGQAPFRLWANRQTRFMWITVR